MEENNDAVAATQPQHYDHQQQQKDKHSHQAGKQRQAAFLTSGLPVVRATHGGGGQVLA